MSQVFAGDAVNNTSPVTIPTSGAVTAVTGNFLNPPFGNAKCFVIATVFLNSGTGAVSVTLGLRRNPNAENLALPVSGGTTTTGGLPYAVTVMAADVIPDGRPVQYVLNVLQTGASATGTISSASIAAFLISG